MFAKYISTVTATRAQVINDLCLLLSGSPLSALATSCDKVNSTLLSTVLPGWTLVDAAAPLSGCVISSPDLEGLTTKYVGLRTGGVSGVDIEAVGYETWNAVAHTGTNTCTSSSSAAYGAGSLPYVAASINTYWVFATPRSFYIVTLTGIGIGAFEFTRDCEYLKGTTYPCFAIMASNVIYQDPGISQSQNIYTPLQAGVPRMKNLSSPGDITGAPSKVSPASMYARYTYGSYWTNSVNVYGIIFASKGIATTKLLDATETPYYELRPLWAVFTPNLTQNNQPVIGKFFDILEIGPGLANTLDTFNDGTTTYAVINIGGTNSALAFKIA